MWNTILWISYWLVAFVLQDNIVSLNIPIHISPSKVGICYYIGYRIDKLHFCIVRIVLDCHISRNRHLYHAFLHTAFDVICFSDMSEVAFARRIFHMGYCCFNVFDLEDKTGK